jgi:hypothetical protein
MEFLMTYGWAILVVLVVIGVLAYFGIFDPDVLLPEKCAVQQGINCNDYRIVNDVIADRIDITLANGMGETILIGSIQATSRRDAEISCSYDAIAASDSWGGKNGKVLNDGRTATFSLTCTPSDSFNDLRLSGKNSFDLEVNWFKPVSSESNTHAAKGEILASIEASNSLSKDVCFIAQTDGLCDGLDVVFGTGYRAACCSEFISCC